jgi:serine protease Do
LIGSGFFVDSSGKLLTTASVAANAARMTIEWHGNELPIQPVGVDTRANVGMFQLATNAGATTTFPALAFGDAKALRVGSVVIAMGAPFHHPPAPSFGVVDGFDLPRGPKQCVTSHIRADIPLNPGEGGGPLLNSHGEVVGLLVASVEQARTCYALPSHALRRLIADFEQYGEVRYGWMGMSVRECDTGATNASKCKTAIKVQQVLADTPAARAGIRTDDTIIQLGNTPVERLCDMIDTTFAARVGEKIKVQVQRESLLTNLLIEVVQRPAALSGMKATPASANR